MDGLSHGNADAALDLYVRLLPPSEMEALRSGQGWSGGGGLFSPALTVWLFVRQRLAGAGTLESTWLGLDPEEARALSPRSARSKRPLSAHPSGFDRARRALPLPLAMEAARRLVSEARAFLREGDDEEPVYLLDGSSVTPENHPALAKAFPPARNQHGESHWPVARMVVAHELTTGIASVPEWGPMYGEGAVGEQELAKKLLPALPEGGLVIADRNFGVFSIAWALRERRFLLRMTDQRAKALARASLDGPLDERLAWRAGAADLRGNAEVPKGAEVLGRLVVVHVSDPTSKRPVRACLFTNDLDRSPEELARLYARRWSVETDLRSLKREVGLEILRSRTPETLAKELVFAVVAYDLLRVVMALAARRKGLEPRRMSFTRARHVVEIHARRGPLTPESFDRMLDLIAARPLPVRTREKKPERKVWRRPAIYPARKPGP
jgi:hypothetical protein